MSLLGHFKKCAVLVSAASSVGSIADASDRTIETRLPSEERNKVFEQLIAAQLDGPGKTHAVQELGGGDFVHQVIPPHIGIRIGTVEVTERNASGTLTRLTKLWTELTRDEFVRELSSQYTSTIVSQYDQNGSISVTYSATADARAEKGRHQLTFNNYYYRPYPCSEDDPGAGNIAVGVGIQIIVDANVKKRGFNFGFGPLALAASKNEVSGKIDGYNRGLVNAKNLTQMMGELSSAPLSFDSVIKASNAIAAAGTALDNIQYAIEPFVMGHTDERAPGSCIMAWQKSRDEGQVADN